MRRKVPKYTKRTTLTPFERIQTRQALASLEKPALGEVHWHNPDNAEWERNLIAGAMHEAEMRRRAAIAAGDQQ